MRALRQLTFFATPPDTCGYLPDREAVNAVADPRVPMTTGLYSELIDLGFRRSGRHVYRPHCPGCSACVPARIPVAHFQPNRSQKRNARLNRDLHVRIQGAGFSDEQYALYEQYVRHRHPGGGMDQPTPESYLRFLTCDWCETWFVEFRDGDNLAAVAVTDRLEHALSAVYTFFDPAARQRGLGTYAILWQIEQARLLGLDYLYLGYWIDESPKMRYKRHFRPLEGRIDGYWRELSAG